MKKSKIIVFVIAICIFIVVGIVVYQKTEQATAEIGRAKVLQADEQISDETQKQEKESNKQGTNNNEKGQEENLENAQSIENVKIKLTFDNEEVIIKMENNAQAREFLSRLPLELEFEEYAGTEKIGYLSEKLDISNTPAGLEPSKGDFAYYAPWRNIAVFYGDDAFTRSLVKIGTIESGIEKLEKKEKNFKVKIEKVAE